LTSESSRSTLPTYSSNRRTLSSRDLPAKCTANDPGAHVSARRPKRHCGTSKTKLLLEGGSLALSLAMQAGVSAIMVAAWKASSARLASSPDDMPVGPVAERQDMMMPIMAPCSNNGCDANEGYRPHMRRTRLRENASFRIRKASVLIPFSSPHVAKL
jgi:hypothetical protein